MYDIVTIVCGVFAVACLINILGHTLYNWIDFIKKSAKNTFRKGSFQASSLARQIHNFDSRHFVQNSPIAFCFRHIYHFSTIVSYIMS